MQSNLAIAGTISVFKVLGFSSIKMVPLSVFAIILSLIQADPGGLAGSGLPGRDAHLQEAGVDVAFCGTGLIIVRDFFQRVWNILVGSEQLDLIKAQYSKSFIIIYFDCKTFDTTTGVVWLSCV